MNANEGKSRNLVAIGMIVVGLICGIYFACSDKKSIFDGLIGTGVVLVFVGFYARDGRPMKRPPCGW